MNAHARRTPRPRKLVWITLALAVATGGLALRWTSPALSPGGVAHVPIWFDVVFGIVGGLGLAWLALRLWRQGRRDADAAVFALSGWMLLAAGVTLRAALFAQAEYERGRLPAFVLATAVLVAIAAIVWRRSAKRENHRDTGNTEKRRGI